MSSSRQDGHEYVVVGELAHALYIACLDVVAHTLDDVSSVDLGVIVVVSVRALQAKCQVYKFVFI